MSKLTILRGISGSGKSTYAKAYPFAKVISRDDLRVFFYGSDGHDYHTSPDIRSKEDFITKMEFAMTEAALLAGQHVISDNTHVEWKFVKAIAAVAQKVGAEVDIVEFDVPLRTAQERDALRGKRGGRHVGGAIIERQYKRFQGTKGRTAADLPEAFVPVPYKAPKNPHEVPAVLVDIDGTLAHMRDLRGPFDWHKVGVDEPDLPIIDLVNELANQNVIIVMSGRDESCRNETIAWLNKHGVEFDFLYMRPEKDMRKDNIVKDELFEKNVAGHYNVRLVLDDRKQVVDMWRAKGLKCLQVEEGNF